MIAIVDDDASICRALKRLLSSLGYHVEVFNSATEFLNSDPSRDFECLILDIHMTGITGLDLQEKLIERGVKIPIIFITAHDDENTRRKVMESSAVAYLRKPFDDHALIAAIHKARSTK